MNASPPTAWERGLRRVLTWIIGIFVLLVFVPFVGMTLFDIVSRPGPFPWRQLLPVVIVMSGPCLLWVTLAAMYFKAPRELRSIYFSGWGPMGGILNFGRIFQFFGRYRKRFGIDVWFWLMMISIPWSVIVFYAVLRSSAPAPQ